MTNETRTTMKRIIGTILTASMAVLVSAGCTKRTLAMPTKAGPFVYESQRFGNKETLKEATFVGADGSSFAIRGFTSDQVEALSAVAEAASRGAVQAFMGGATPGTLSSVVSRGLPPQATAPKETELPDGVPAVVAGPDGRVFKLLVRNGAVLLVPKDEVAVNSEAP